MFVFNGKIQNLQTRKYDASMTSSIAKNIELFCRWNTCFPLNILYKLCVNLTIFQKDKKNVSGCFF